MVSTKVQQKRRQATPRRQKFHGASRPATAARTGPSPQAKQDSGELASRPALMARLEEQREELLRTMSCVSFARRTIAEHAAFGGEPPVTAEQHAVYRERVLQALSDAGEALGTAYPMLERIAQALAVDEILKGLSPTIRQASTAGKSAKAGHGKDRRAVA